MYPFPVVIVGVEPTELPALRRELTHNAAEIHCELPGLVAASECLRGTRQDPRLLIVQVSPACDLEILRRMSDDLATWPILALVPPHETAARILAINRAGASQILPFPCVPDEFRRAVHRLGDQFSRSHHDRQVFAVAGAVGGSGTSMIAINLADEIALQFRRKTILSEFTLQFGALTSLLDIHPRVTIAQLLREIQRVDDLMVENSLVTVGDGLRVLAGSHEMGTSHPVEPSHFARLLSCLRKIADVSVIDIPEMFHGPASNILEMADRIVLVALQNIPSIRSLQAYCRHLPDERLNHGIWVAINRFNPQLKGFSVAEVKAMLGTPNVVTIANDFAAVNQAINQGCPLRQAAPKTPILRDIDKLSRALLGHEQAASGRRPHLLRRVFGVAAT